jgi:hypothetical protein
LLQSWQLHLGTWDLVHTCSTHRPSCAWPAAPQATMPQTARKHSAAHQPSSAGQQQCVSNMQGGHEKRACKYVTAPTREAETCHPVLQLQYTQTHLLGAWAAERSAAPDVAARLPDCLLLPLPGRQPLLLLPCQDGVAAAACWWCCCSCTARRGVHALDVAASCCLLTWGAPAAVRSLHTTRTKHTMRQSSK